MTAVKKFFRYYAPGIILIGIVIIAYLIIQKYYCPYIIAGPSMEPTYHAGNVVMTEPVEDELLTRDRVVIVRSENKSIIKRIEGVPGDTVSVGGKPYTLKADEYYVLGDNRDESYDSRAFGPVKKEDIRAVVAKTLI